MSSLGSHLRELRERRAVSLDEMSRVTRVPRSYLEALETGEMSQLPAPVFVRGFIRAYCQVLGEAPAEALAHYDNRDSTGGTAGAAEAATVVRRPSSRAQRQGTVLVSLVLLVVLGVALFAVTLALQSGRGESGRPEATTVAGRPPEDGVAREAPAAPVSAMVSTPPAEPGEPTTAQPPATPAAAASPPAAGAMPQTPPAGSRPPRAALSAGSAGATAGPAPPASASPAAAASAPTPVISAAVPSAGAPIPAAARAVDATARAAERPATTAPDAGTSRARDAERLVASVTSPYRLIARTTEATWVRVRTEDGRQLSEETIPVGQVREWVSNQRFEVTVGNAAGIRLELNGQTLPVLGASREVVKLALPPQVP
jgi:cytoskeleton protein RodZ